MFMFKRVALVDRRVGVIFGCFCFGRDAVSYVGTSAWAG